MPGKRPEDDMSVYDPSDSEDDYKDTDKALLQKVRNKGKEYSDSEEEVFNVAPNEYDNDDDDDQSDLALSDVEGQGSDDDLPDVRAWGKEKRQFYSTDYVDPDYGGFQGKDAHLAELEEEEARNLQKQLAQQLDDDDFTLEIFNKKTGDDKAEVEELVKTDISKLSKRQKLQILRKESPEFFSLVEDFEAKMTIVRDYLKPILVNLKRKKLTNCKAVDFVQTHHELILNYCVNIYMYLLLKASKVNVQNHPVVKRLYQYRQLLSQLTPVFEEIVKPQIEIILKDMQTNDEALERENEKKKTLKLLANLTKNETQSKQVASERVDEIVAEVDADEEENDSEVVKQNEEDDVKRRAITYKMAKNKGLTPHRKKEDRNPRVKHKLKYRKALIRRKGAVREPRKELSRYSGEISGIKTTVSKGIKIKT